jgi:hypothetical protein
MIDCMYMLFMRHGIKHWSETGKEYERRQGEVNRIKAYIRSSETC